MCPGRKRCADHKTGTCFAIASRCSLAQDDEPSAMWFAVLRSRCALRGLVGSVCSGHSERSESVSGVEESPRSDVPWKETLRRSQDRYLLRYRLALLTRSG